MMTRNKLAAFFGVAVLVGCQGRPSIIPSSDPALRKTSTQFAADAAKRNYEADAPRGGEAAARAEVDYTLKELHIANLSSEDWHDVEVWVNQRWVVFIPVLPHQQAKTEGFRRINFQMLYDRNGTYFPVSLFKSKEHIEKVEVYHDDKMYDVPLHLVAD
jgi:hypothetical protein